VLAYWQVIDEDESDLSTFSTRRLKHGKAPTPGKWKAIRDQAAGGSPAWYRRQR